MAVSTKFKVFGESSENLYTDAEYSSLTERNTGCMPNTPILSKVINTALRETSAISCAIVDLLADSTTLGVSSTKTTIQNSINAGLLSYIKTNTIFECSSSLVNNITQLTFKWGNKNATQTSTISSIVALNTKNILDGSFGSIPYQTASSTTSFTNLEQSGESYLISKLINGTYTPKWELRNNMTINADNIVGGANLKIPYQFASNTTAFSEAPSTNSQQSIVATLYNSAQGSWSELGYITKKSLIDDTISAITKPKFKESTSISFGTFNSYETVYKWKTFTSLFDEENISESIANGSCGLLVEVFSDNPTSAGTTLYDSKLLPYNSIPTGIFTNSGNQGSSRHFTLTLNNEAVNLYICCGTNTKPTTNFERGTYIYLYYLYNDAFLTSNLGKTYHVKVSLIRLK